jgi:asparagine synthase (glutamine-hydrolysing)
MMARLRAEIRDLGIRVVLTGEGGDHGFSGSLYHYTDLLRQFRLRDAWTQFRADARVSDIGWSPSRIFTTGVVPLLPRTFKNAVRPLAHRLGWPGGPPRWIPADFASRTGLNDGCPVRPALDASFSDTHVCETLESGWSTLALEMAERTAARFGLEERHPFFDRRIVEFAIAIPETQRWRDTRTKLVLRNAMRDLLPSSVYGRSDKADFSAHVVAALQTLGGDRFLSQLQIGSHGWIDVTHVRLMYRDMMQRFEHGEASYTEYMFPLWMIASTELWFRTLTGAAQNGGWHQRA